MLATLLFTHMVIILVQRGGVCFFIIFRFEFHINFTFLFRDDDGDDHYHALLGSRSSDAFNLGGLAANIVGNKTRIDGHARNLKKNVMCFTILSQLLF